MTSKEADDDTLRATSIESTSRLERGDYYGVDESTYSRYSKRKIRWWYDDPGRQNLWELRDKEHCPWWDWVMDVLFLQT